MEAQQTAVRGSRPGRTHTASAHVTLKLPSPALCLPIDLPAGALNYPKGRMTIVSALGPVEDMENVTVTERAVRRIGEILGKEPAGAMLRVSVEGGGCSGFQYKFDIDRAQAEDDTVISRSGVSVLIDAISLNYLAGSEIDYVDDLIGDIERAMAVC